MWYLYADNNTTHRCILAAARGGTPVLGPRIVVRGLWVGGCNEVFTAIGQYVGQNGSNAVTWSIPGKANREAIIVYKNGCTTEWALCLLECSFTFLGPVPCVTHLQKGIRCVQKGWQVWDKVSIIVQQAQQRFHCCHITGRRDLTHCLNLPRSNMNAMGIHSCGAYNTCKRWLCRHHLLSTKWTV